MDPVALVLLVILAIPVALSLIATAVYVAFRLGVWTINGALLMLAFFGQWGYIGVGFFVIFFVIATPVMAGIAAVIGFFVTARDKEPAPRLELGTKDWRILRGEGNGDPETRQEVGHER
ncbi:hypothetical protein [Arhodomonas sp. SL1]|uniref:hypothetical protein n=1 Tax=Arhodomonas sp. SL1 TaxID=3425691 RepID=UPI003F88490C